MSKILILIAIVFICTCGCTNKTTVAVVRNPIIEFKYNAISWTDNSYSITGPTKIVAYPADTTLPGKLYSRYIILAYGKDTKGDNLQFTINFDVADPAQMVGIYKSAYNSKDGLGLTQLYNLDGNNLSDYALYTGDTTSFLQIQRQSAAEMLIAGIFQMTLYNTRDTSQRIYITDGVLTDITY